MKLFTMNSKKIRIIRNLSIIVFLFAITIYLYARTNGSNTGLTSASSPGCDCHGDNASSATTVTVTSETGSFNVQPGSTTNFTITVSNASKVAAGIDIAVKTTETGSQDAGSLSAITGLQRRGTELTHSGPRMMSGGSASFNFSWTAPSTPGTYYLRAVANAVNGNNNESGDAWNWMPVQIITVVPNASITLTSPNGSENWCKGSTQNITWTSSSVQNVRIELSDDGGNNYTVTLVNSTPASTGSWQWTISNDLADGILYKIRLSDASNPNLNSSSISIFSITGSPKITQEPIGQTVYEGTDVDFSIKATGKNIKYQWKKNGTNIDGQTTSILHLSAVTLNDAADYTCVASNQCGSETSTNATLVVNQSNNHAVLQLNDSIVDFGMVVAANAKDSVIHALIKNIGNTDMVISAINTSGSSSSEFSVLTTLPFTVKPGETKDLEMGFRPQTGGKKEAILSFVSNSTTSPTLHLKGFGGVVNLSFSPDVLNFLFLNNDVSPVNKTINLNNDGNFDMNVQLSITGNDASLFTIADADKSFIVKSAEKKQISVKLTPLKDTKTANAVLKLASQYKQLDLNLTATATTNGVNDTENNSLTDIKTYPNPSSSEMNIQFISPIDDKCDIVLTDISGLKIKELSRIALKNGMNNLVWDLFDSDGNAISSGTYFMIIKTSFGTYTKKFVITK